MSYRWVDHTAELELEIEGTTEEEVFAQSLEALAELLTDERPSHTGDTRVELTLTGSDRALLLADWLDELVFLTESEGLVAQSLERLELDDCGLGAVVRAVRIPSRPLIKGVTHHRLAFDRCADRFEARVILDV
jgi:SHS2 domain-containing protein